VITLYTNSCLLPLYSLTYWIKLLWTFAFFYLKYYFCCLNINKLNQIISWTLLYSSFIIYVSKLKKLYKKNTFILEYLNQCWIHYQALLQHRDCRINYPILVYSEDVGPVSESPALAIKGGNLINDVRGSVSTTRERWPVLRLNNKLQPTGSFPRYPGPQ